jgi:hypothetical protein
MARTSLSFDHQFPHMATAFPDPQRMKQVAHPSSVPHSLGCSSASG